MTDIDSRAGRTAATSDQASPAALFGISAKYLIDPESATEDIGTDIACFSDALEATIQAIIDATESDGHLDGLLFAALYQARQVSGASAEYVRRTASSSASRSPTQAGAAAATPESPIDSTSLVAALKNASTALYNAHRSARSVVAILDRVDFDSAMSSDVRGNSYDLVHPVEVMLAQARDDSLAESEKIDALLSHLAAAPGGVQ